jgi:hypothetical protein
MSTDNDEQYKNSPQWIKDVIDKKGDKMNEAREIFRNLIDDVKGRNCLEDEEVKIDTALKQLKELVEGRKKPEWIDLNTGKPIDGDMSLGHNYQSDMSAINFNRGVEAVADMIYKPRERG